jgi:hypothetical protein
LFIGRVALAKVADPAPQGDVVEELARQHSAIAAWSSIDSRNEPGPPMTVLAVVAHQHGIETQDHAVDGAAPGGETVARPPRTLPDIVPAVPDHIDHGAAAT